MRKLYRRRLSAQSGHTQSGFTLVELLVVIVILGFVGGALGMAFLVAGRSAATTTQRFNESHDAQVTSAYLASDVQSAAALTSDTCYADSLTNKINFSYDRGLSIASYAYGTSGGETKVVRRFCDTGGNLIADTTVVSFAGAVAPVFTCDGSPCNPASPPPRTVKMAISEAGGYSYVLSGSRRGYAGAGATPGDPSAYPSLLALGNSGIQIQGGGVNARLAVSGGVIVNSNARPAIVLSNSTFSYDSLEIFGGGTCPSCASVPENRTNRVPDPLAGLPAPSTAGLPTNPPKVGDNYFPGIYTTPFTPDGFLQPGVYVLQQGLCVSGHQQVKGDEVLLYITGGPSCGAVSVTGSDATVTLTPQISGAYQAITIWSTSTAALTIAGNGAATSIGGLIYAPNASSVTLGAGNGGLFIGSIIAPNLTFSGNGNVCVGYSNPADCAAP